MRTALRTASAGVRDFDEGQEGAEHFQIRNISHFADNGPDKVAGQIRRLEKPGVVQAAEGFLKEEAGALDPDGADPDLRVLGIPDLEAGQEIQQSGFHQVIQRGGNISFFDGGAVLAAIDKGAADQVADRSFHFGIGGDDGRGHAAGPGKKEFGKGRGLSLIETTHLTAARNK